MSPKPKGFLRLEYGEPEYVKTRSDCPYQFEMNGAAKAKKPKRKSYCAIDLNYPGLKGTIHVTYRPVEGNVVDLIRDAERLTHEHTIKADAIGFVPMEDSNRRAYGAVYEIEGNAASPLQFYVTDSVNHFVRGAVYFRMKPNYDSIFPAANYLKKDVKRLMDSIVWEEEKE